MLLDHNWSSGAVVGCPSGRENGWCGDLGSVTRLHQHLIMEIILLPDTTNHWKIYSQPSLSFLALRRLNSGSIIVIL